MTASGNRIIATAGGAAPEPSTWAMLLTGFAGLGFVGYRRAEYERLRRVN